MDRGGRRGLSPAGCQRLGGLYHRQQLLLKQKSLHDIISTMFDAFVLLIAVINMLRERGDLFTRPLLLTNR
jgi:hypothetical protein